MKTIFVPLDGAPESERAASVAQGVASAWGAEVVLVSVASLPEAAEHELEDLRKRIGARSARIEVVRSTDVIATISDLVDGAPDPIICMTSRGRGALSRAIVGGIGERTLENVGCPVLFVGPHCGDVWPTQSRRILACLDQSETSEPVIEPATAWASELDLELWLAEVFHPRDVDSRQAPYRFLDTVVERLRPGLPGVRACVAWSSDVGAEIAHLAHSLAPSLVIVGTHGLDGFERLTFGSVAMAVVHQAPCPVLVIGPAARRRRFAATQTTG